MNAGPLVICLGNPLRGDDGLGPAVGAHLVRLGLPEGAVRITTGLLPEHAVEVAAADAVLFVDASTDLPPGEVRVSPVTPADTGARWTHHLSPAGLLALAAQAFGRTPPASLVAVGGRGWDFGTGLSAEIESSVHRVAALVVGWWNCHAGPAENRG